MVCSLFSVINGCKDSGGPEVEEDKSPYYVKLTMDTLQHTYPGGGGIFVIHRGDSVKEDETVEIKIETDPSIKYNISSVKLTKEERISEMELFPDSNISPGKYPVKFICSYGKKVDTLKAMIWHWQEIPRIPDMKTSYLLQDFIDWIDRNKPEYSISKITDWKCYTLTPAAKYLDGGPDKFINKEWEVTHLIVLHTPPWTVKAALRRRFKDKYFSLAMKINELYKVEEIPPKDFYKCY